MKLYSLPLITVLVTALAALSPSQVSAQQKFWCGKPYTPKKQARSIIPDYNEISDSFWRRAGSTNSSSSGNNNATIILPVQNTPLPTVPNLSKGYAAMVRIQPYLDTDQTGSLVVNVVNASGPISIEAALQDDGTEVLPKTPINIKDMAVEVQFSISKIAAKLTPYTLKVNFYSGSGNSPVDTVYAKLYRLPSGPKTVKLDRLYGGIITATNDVIFPTGPYVDFGWLGNGDISANLKTLKSLGYNVINPDPTYTDLTIVDNMFKAADSLGGIYIELSFRYSFTNTQQVVSQVNQFKQYNSLLVWYTADEPDGEQWTDSSAELTVYNAIKAADPYHPVGLVLNCQNTAAFYADTTDILGTDVYPVGVNMSHCTDTTDVCGCDLCLGDASLDVQKRTTRYMNDLTLIGRQSINQWMVLQAFSDPTTWWQTMPSPAQYRFMSYISIIDGYKSIMFWKYPFTPNDSLKDATTKIANDTVNLSPYILGMQQLPASHYVITGNGIYTGGWLSGDGKSFLAIVANGNPSATTSFTVSFKDLAKFSMSGKGTTDSGGQAQVQMQNGAISGSLKPYEIGYYTFGDVPTSISGSNVGSNATTSSSSPGDKSPASKNAARSGSFSALVGIIVVAVLFSIF